VRGRRSPAGRSGLVEQADRRAFGDLTETARNHIEHVYMKIGISSRATASLFAMQHGLLSDEHLAPA
jgi:hypothetical protein